MKNLHNRDGETESWMMALNSKQTKEYKHKRKQNTTQNDYEIFTVHKQNKVAHETKYKIAIRIELCNKQKKGVNYGQLFLKE